LPGENTDGLDYIYSLGLISTPDRAAARSALQEALADPDHPIAGTFLYTLRMVNSEPGASNANWREGQQRALEALIAALNTKRGKALSVSLSTAVNEAWSLTALPKETTDKLVNQLVSMFDQLPLHEQSLGQNRKRRHASDFEALRSGVQGFSRNAGIERLRHAATQRYCVNTMVRTGSDRSASGNY
jgi:hypothetical protein